MTIKQGSHPQAPRCYRALAGHSVGVATADGDGVKLTRIIGSGAVAMLDPFLLLDCFESENANDYIGGFPTHPHRGFETVTYMLAGKMRHRDSAGHEGVVEPGGVQWMTAARGILHSEMPEQQQGLLKGFQLWVNLPAAAKMSPAGYQEYPPSATPLERRDNGTEIRVIAGKTDHGTLGPVVNHYTYPTYLDIDLPENTAFTQTLEPAHNAFIYVISGQVSVVSESREAEQVELGSPATTPVLSAKSLGVLTLGELVQLQSGPKGARLLLIAAKQLNEPVARHGPFVMNTRAELVQAFADFSRGVF
ncbi:pirin family protein [Shewanella sp. NIFS-20-20]|uniref:pirin family protein n=1 Tax=Shewanella sp. NIFS-20-20 TaxID=2853806 RepID=UPI001C45C492|nr:pirin family protein [Shewanella sp. NIFS-20-20]MBV7315370.1 pirin family protein [Shewanella sp. NIFS-20-20]